MHQPMQEDSLEPATVEKIEEECCAMPIPISLIVSSSNWNISFGESSGHSSADIGDIVSRLSRIASFPSKLLEENERSMSNVYSVKCEPLYNLEKTDKKDPDESSTPAASSDAQSRQKEEELTKVSNILYHDISAGVLIRQYLGLLVQKNSQRNDLSVGVYVDSASGEERQIGGEAIALVLVSCSSFNESCGDNKDALQENLKCPISRGIMQEPVTFLDGKTYDRAWIEK